MAVIPAPGSVSFEDIVTKKVPHEWGYGSTPRTAKLRDDLFYKAAVVKDWGAVFSGIFDNAALQDKIGFRKEVRLDTDRARLITESYKETEGQPEIIRRANAIAKVCEEMPVFIKPGELIVGDPNSAPDEVRWFPEIAVSYMPDAITIGGFSKMVTAEERQETIEVCDYWKSRCLEARIEAAIPPAMNCGMAGMLGAPPGMNQEGGIYSESASVPAYDYDKLFQDGLKARIERAEAQLKALEDNCCEMNPVAFLEKSSAWKAMIISGKAIIRFAERHAELARELAAKESDPANKKNLEEIAETLDWVPANPPRTFRESLQFYWMVEVVGRYLAVHGYGCGIRIDQVWWPYYKADMEADRITRAEALELIECLFIKVQEVGIPACWPVFFAALCGGEIYYTCNIGGSM